MKKILIVLSLVICLTGCSTNKVSDAKTFKDHYESFNGQSTGTKDSNGNDINYRSINIDENNPINIVSEDDIVNMVNNKDTFIVYFGFATCPWCRTVVPYMIDTANKMGIKKIYYVNVRPDDTSNSDIRDVFTKDDSGNIVLSHNGTDGYHQLLSLFSNVLPEWSLHGLSVAGTSYAGTLRIGAPQFIIVKDGKAVDSISGISDSQTDGYMDLTDDMINDMNNKFTDFFNEYLEKVSTCSNTDTNC